MQPRTSVVLISDDEFSTDEICQAFKICLPETELLSANLGSEGIKLAKSVSPDILIVDMSISDMSVWDVFSQINRGIQIPTILLSYSREESEIVKSLEMGFDTYIVKPFRQLEFMAHVRSILRRNYSKCTH